MNMRLTSKIQIETNSETNLNTTQTNKDSSLNITPYNTS